MDQVFNFGAGISFPWAKADKRKGLIVRTKLAKQTARVGVGKLNWIGVAAVFAIAGLSIPPSAFAENAAPQQSQTLPDWKDTMNALAAIQQDVAGEIPNATDPLARQEAWSLMFTELARGYLLGLQSDPNYPEFVPFYNADLNVAAPNPDYIYYMTPLDGAGRYRLRGNTGTARFTYLQFSDTDFYHPTQKKPAVLGGFALNELNTNPDGSFELILSAERPAGYAGNWRKLDPATKGVFMRAASYDWLHERDPVVGIERLDAPAMRPRPSATELAARLAALPAFVESDTLVWWRHMADLQKRDMWNRIGVEPWGTFPGQVYLEGLYRLADDEALVIETDVPKSCRYWSFLVGDMQFRTVDWVNHQSSLNGFQAHIDSDGKFRAVISKTDPGVPNWLDSGGYSQGVIQGRWNECDSSPIPTTKVVKLSQLRSYLPADTPAVTPAARQEALRDRRLGAQMRRKW